MGVNSYFLNAEVINDMIFVICQHQRAVKFSVKYYNDKEDNWPHMSTCVIKNLSMEAITPTNTETN
ncbi:hypothetical protein L798_02675 [Zootermopsis nevadensis]|uniref:Uncharacterized protein n=1 Tax=Zootermopsis nevadensis TaxID=136037 RepID=A0A067QHH5_ZOONE|nr:hypothetical protein L798_02675 [Zootermopsis nevadensis]